MLEPLTLSHIAPPPTTRPPISSPSCDLRSGLGSQGESVRRFSAVTSGVSANPLRLESETRLSLRLGWRQPHALHLSPASAGVKASASSGCSAAEARRPHAADPRSGQTNQGSRPSSRTTRGPAKLNLHLKVRRGLFITEECCHGNRDSGAKRAIVTHAD